MAATPVFFPAVCAFALYPYMTRLSRILWFLWVFTTYSIHALLVLTGIDLSVYGLDFGPPVEIFGTVLDGHSVGGQPYGIKTDLFTSMPQTRGDGMFLHALMFTFSVLLTF